MLVIEFYELIYISPIFWQAGAKNPVVRLFIIDTAYPEHVGPREVPVPAMIASRYSKLSCFLS